MNFLGGKIDNYLANPYLWSWSNFDGEHYLSIAQKGYLPLQYYFFPFYPLLIHFLGGTVLSAILISNLSFFIALIGFYKLVMLDFSKHIARLSVVLLLLFPTSFYFAAVYTESLFLALVVWFFYFLRSKKWLLAGILGSLASATRLIGAFLGFPIGLLGYMLFLQKTIGDSLAFLHNLSVFGTQRSETLVILPQVFYRYFVKIIPNINYSHFSASLPIILETLVAILFLILILVSYKKINFHYWTYMTLGYLTPTLSGSFSSLPRYVLVLFPGFILMAIAFNKFSPLYKNLVFGLLLIALIIFTSFFVRGYWVA